MKASKKTIQSVVYGLITSILICFGTIVIVWWILPALIVTPREKMQKELAKELGVEIQDYPSPSSFPSGYFYTVLKPGMSITEVHEIVRGYEKVVHCKRVSEIYYYFSVDLEHAQRFKLVSDNEGKYSRFEGEEADSRTLSTNGCLPGLIAESRR